MYIIYVCVTHVLPKNDRMGQLMWLICSFSPPMVLQQMKKNQSETHPVCATEFRGKPQVNSR